MQFNVQSLVNGKPQAISPDSTVHVIDYRSNDVRDEVLFANLWMHKAPQVLAISGYTNAYSNRARTIVNNGVYNARHNTLKPDFLLYLSTTCSVCKE